MQYKSRDSEYLYRPDSDVAYLTGFPEPGAVVVLRAFSDEERFVLFVAPRDERAERWSGARFGPERAAEAFGADAAYPLTELEERLPGLLRDADRIHYRLGRDARTQRLVEAALEEARARGARRGAGPRGVLDPGLVLDPLRRVKDAAELALLRRAAAATVAGVRAGLEAIRPGRREAEVQAAAEAAFVRTGARRPAFATIVAAGTNACVLHYVENEGIIGGTDLVLIDAGAELGLYCGDVTRTVPAGGRFTPEQRAVYDVVAEAQRSAIQAVAPGRPASAPHRAATRALAEGLRSLGVVEGEVDGILERKELDPWYPHQSSHWLGMDVHDVGDYAHADEPVLLEAGMVLTVEPGLYFPPGTEGAAAPFAGIGIRIEDDLVVTSEGRENLTESLPVDAAAVASLVGQGD